MTWYLFGLSRVLIVLYGNKVGIYCNENKMCHLQWNALSGQSVSIGSEIQTSPFGDTYEVCCRFERVLEAKCWWYRWYEAFCWSGFSSKLRQKEFRCEVVCWIASVFLFFLQSDPTGRAPHPHIWSDSRELVRPINCCSVCVCVCVCVCVSVLWLTSYMAAIMKCGMCTVSLAWWW